MSRDLPQWNETETDLLPQFQATYGHVIVGAQFAARLVERLLHCDITEIKPGGNPARDSAGWWTFRTEPETMLILEAEEFFVLYADSAHFLRNDRWSKGSKDLKVACAVGTCLDEQESFYRIFKNGELAATRIRRGEGLRPPPPLHVTATIGGAVVAKFEEQPESGGSFERWIRQTPRPVFGGGDAEKFIPVAAGGAVVRLVTLQTRPQSWFARWFKPADRPA